MRAGVAVVSSLAAADDVAEGRLLAFHVGGLDAAPFHDIPQA